MIFNTSYFPSSLKLSTLALSMNAPSPNRAKSKQGFTLLEMSLVIMMLIALIAMSSFGGSAISTWTKGRDASEILRGAYIAQRTYLADNPTAPLSSLSEAKLLPYLPIKTATFPKVKGLDGTMRSINVNVSPPVVKDTSGSTYDPSGSPKDSLWDVGE